MSRVSDVSKNLLSAAKNRLLVVTDGIIALSLMRKGARPKPGQRQPWPDGLREGLYRAQARRCVYCGKQLRLKLGFSHIDHITPVNQGDTNDEVNLQLLCPGCNADKGMYFIWDFTQLNVRPHSRVGLLKYKIAPKCSLSGPFRHSGVGRNPGAVRPVRSYNLNFTYPCQRGWGTT